MTIAKATYLGIVVNDIADERFSFGRRKGMCCGRISIIKHRCN